MYGRILLPVDGSRRSAAPLPYAEALAAAWGCPLELVHVAADGTVPSAVAPPGHDVRPLVGDDPAVVLAAEAHATDPPALTCLASRARGAVGGALFGTVTGRLLRHLHGPVVVIGPAVLAPAGTRSEQPHPDAPHRPRRLLVCLDGSTTAASILPTARTWAAQLDLAVVFVHVEYPLEGPSAGRATVPVETRVVAGELARTADEWRAAGIDATWHVVGDTATATGIVRQAAHRDTDLVVMATHGRTGLERVLVGSTAAEVVRQSPVPVLLRRPSELH